MLKLFFAAIDSTRFDLPEHLAAKLCMKFNQSLINTTLLRPRSHAANSVRTFGYKYDGVDSVDGDSSET